MPATASLPPSRPAVRTSKFELRSSQVGGEGRIRTFEAAGATDLQSVAFDRFATSPKLPADVPGANVACRVGRSSVRVDAPRDAVRLVSFVGGVAGIVELAKGFEPPTG